MVWKILRPHYWILDRRVRTTNRVIVIALILLLLLGGQWAYDNLIRDNLALLNSEQAVTAIASSLPLGFFFLLLFAMLGVGDVMHQLYLASDLELLMIAPVPYRTIFLVKLLQCSRATLIPALGFGAFLLALGLARDAAASYYLLAVLLILAAMTLTTAVVMILVILLARLLPAQKTRSWMPATVVLATFVLMLCQQSATQWFLGQAGLIAFLTEALLNPEQLGLVVTGLGGLALVTGLVAYRTFDTSFHEGWNRFREVPTRRAPVSLAVRRPWGVSRWVQPLPAPLRFFLVKEWLELKRNPRGLINLAQPLVLVVVVLAPFMSGGKGVETLRPLIFWYMLVLLVLFLSTLPTGAPLMAVAQEGRRMALLHSAPISMSDVLKGKFWATWVPIVLSWVLVFLIAGMWLQFPLWQTGFLMGMTIWGLAGASVATVAMGGLKVDFTAEELKQRTSLLTNYLMMGLNLVFVLLTIATFVWLMVRLFPGSRVVLAIQALAGYGVVGWIFSDRLWVPLALVSGQVVFGVGVKVLWDAAVRRLEGWEES
jgi:hypothetical protein